MPTTKNDWGQIAERFNRRWNFPKCCRSIDGKHIQIKRPSNSGSQFFNYKGTYSIILFALVDEGYCFKYLDIGGNGRASDSAIFRDSMLNICMANGTLRSNLMKPHSKHNLSNKEIIFN